MYAKYDVKTVEQDALKYAMANQFLTKLKMHASSLSRQQIKTLRGQALSGDIRGAEKGLAALFRRSESK